MKCDQSQSISALKTACSIYSFHSSFLLCFLYLYSCPCNKHTCVLTETPTLYLQLSSQQTISNWCIMDHMNVFSLLFALQLGYLLAIPATEGLEKNQYEIPSLEFMVCRHKHYSNLSDLLFSEKNVVLWKESRAGSDTGCFWIIFAVLSIVVDHSSFSPITWCITKAKALVVRC